MGKLKCPTCGRKSDARKFKAFDCEYYIGLFGRADGLCGGYYVVFDIDSVTERFEKQRKAAEELSNVIGRDLYRLTYTSAPEYFSDLLPSSVADADGVLFPGEDEDSRDFILIPKNVAKNTEAERKGISMLAVCADGDVHFEFYIKHDVYQFSTCPFAYDVLVKAIENMTLEVVADDVCDSKEE